MNPSFSKGLTEYAEIFSAFLPITGRNFQFPELTIRTIQKSENSSMARIIRTVMSEYHCVGEGYSIQDAEVDTISEAFSQKNSKYLVITDGEEIFGGGGIGPLQGAGPEYCELKKMYFSSQIRGRGMGKELVNQLLEFASQAGYQYCYLETVERLKTANQLYLKCGFERLTGSIGNTGHNSCELQYLKKLK
ncbi:MAG: GNAT family N-acetyltransferase [Saprospiraceae bacterium]